MIGRGRVVTALRPRGVLSGLAGFHPGLDNLRLPADMRMARR
jgi:hypothetical protein